VSAAEERDYEGVFIVCQISVVFVFQLNFTISPTTSSKLISTSALTSLWLQLAAIETSDQF